MNDDHVSRRVAVRAATTAEELDQVYEIRRRVFVEEQHVPLDHERDAIDDRALHVIASLDGKPAAAARLFTDAHDARLAWIGRLAVLPAARRAGVASAIMTFLLDRCRREGISRVRLHAQTYVRELYARLGFVEAGGEFLEENLPHIEMELFLV
ncbi:MAG TPA: GNAT family N-acetyltransferase [Candidatus Ozemobacteraceae bacterium]|nr:GNAT family N-acetyltransferase [Candidatus Ozemobacteraceae bacterium]